MPTLRSSFSPKVRISQPSGRLPETLDKMTDFKKQGRLNKQRGKLFEKLVREDLEKKGWIVSKWNNQIKDGKIHQLFSVIRHWQIYGNQ